VLLAGAMLLAVLLAGGSSRAMLASARLSCFIFLELFIVASFYDRGSVLIWRRIDPLRTSAFVDNVITSYYRPATYHSCVYSAPIRKKNIGALQNLEICGKTR